MGVTAVALLVVAMLPRVGGRHEEVVIDRDTTLTARFGRDGRVEEPVATDRRA